MLSDAISYLVPTMSFIHNLACCFGLGGSWASASFVFAVFVGTCCCPKTSRFCFILFRLLAILLVWYLLSSSGNDFYVSQFSVVVSGFVGAAGFFLVCASFLRSTRVPQKLLGCCRQCAGICLDFVWVMFVFVIPGFVFVRVSLCFG